MNILNGGKNSILEPIKEMILQKNEAKSLSRVGGDVSFNKEQLQPLAKVHKSSNNVGSNFVRDDILKEANFVNFT